jgi:hypothetical protein
MKPILLVVAKTEVRSKEIANLLSGEKFGLPVYADEDKVLLRRPHDLSAFTVKQVKSLARSYSSVINRISV